MRLSVGSLGCRGERDLSITAKQGDGVAGEGCRRNDSENQIRSFSDCSRTTSA